MNPNSTASKLIVIFLELIIPIIGYAFWNWDFVFIMLFFAIDWFVLVIFQTIKIRECYKLRLSSKDRQYLGLSLFFILSKFIGTILVSIVICTIVIPDFNFEHELMRFLAYKDSGIAQGYFLVPLCLLNGYLMYQRDFVKPQLQHNKKVREIFRKSVAIHIIIFVICLFVAALSYFFQLEEIILLYIALACILAGKLYFQILRPNL